MTTTRIIVGDVRAALDSLPAASVHCCVTSPPYWGLRDYGVAGQIGLEPTVDEWVATLVDVFERVRRVLRDDGTCWVNLGDSYCAGRPGGETGSSLQAGGKQHRHSKNGLSKIGAAKPKDLIGQPWRVAFALQAAGWWLRSAIIWHKPNPMPESVTDRPTSAHEYIFLLTKAPRYFYDADAVREPALGTGGNGSWGTRGDAKRAPDKRDDLPTESCPYKADRNLRDVWSIPSEPFPGAHFATFPTRLVEPCIKAGTSERGCCPACGAPWVREVERERTFESGSGRAGNMPVGKHGANLQGGGETLDIRRGPTLHTRTTGWSPSCDCDVIDEPVPCTVLDPFGGSGTTALVANRLQRDGLLCELNPEYAAMAAARIRESVGALFNRVTLEPLPTREVPV